MSRALTRDAAPTNAKDKDARIPDRVRDDRLGKAGVTKSAGRMRHVPGFDPGCGPYNLDSPRPLTEFGTAAQAPWGGAMGWRGYDYSKRRRRKDAGFPIWSGMTD